MTISASTHEHPVFSQALARMPAWAWALVSVAYGLGWFTLLQPSQILWFLPAGLRLAALWLLPAKRWPWLLLGEGLVGAVLLWRSDNLVLDLNFVALSFSPWLGYAVVMWFIRGRDAGPGINTPRHMMMFLSCAFISACAVSPLLSILFRGDAFTEQNFDPGTLNSIFAFAYGDFIGQLIVAPIIVVLATRFTSNLRELTLWYHILIAVAFSALVLLLLYCRKDLAPFLLLLVFAPMFVVAFRKTWVGAAIVITFIGVLFEIYLQHNQLPLDLVVTQLAFALFAASSLLLGAAMYAFRDSHSNLLEQNKIMTEMNATLSHNSQQLRDLSQRIIRFEEQGQRELANELDAELGQAIHHLGTNLNFAIRSVKEPETYRILSTVRDPIRDIEDSLRQVLQQLRPKILDEKGLHTAITAGPLIDTLNDANIKHTVTTEGPIDSLNEDETIVIYRICQLLVRHAYKLGIAQHFALDLSIEQLSINRLRIRLAIAIAVEPSSHRLEANPLSGIRDRVLALNGEYAVSVDDSTIHHHVHFFADLPDNVSPQ
jgi:glucose-6-phosphate-specific signal transduction histidine kinase